MSKPMTDERREKWISLLLDSAKANNDVCLAPQACKAIGREIRRLCEELNKLRSPTNPMLEVQYLREKNERLQEENIALVQAHGELPVTAVRDLRRARGLLKKLVDIEKAYVSNKPLMSCQGQAMSGFDALENFRAVAQEAIKDDSCRKLVTFECKYVCSHGEPCNQPAPTPHCAEMWKHYKKEHDS